jgi:glycine amidinotransferase
MKWIQAPKPTMAESMYVPGFWSNFTNEEKKKFYNENKQSALKNVEMAFDAADISKVGKDIFLRISQTANHMAVDWLRRQFPNLRVHMVFHENDYTRHNDCDLVPVKPPSPGSEGIVLYNS